MNPRFLAESEKGMLWEPRVIESGRGPVEGYKEDEKGKRRASVLSSFSLSWFSVIHVFMLSVHALSSLVRLVTSLREADFWSCVSSAKSMTGYKNTVYKIHTAQHWHWTHKTKCIFKYEVAQHWHWAHKTKCIFKYEVAQHWQWLEWAHKTTCLFKYEECNIIWGRVQLLSKTLMYYVLLGCFLPLFLHVNPAVRGHCGGHPADLSGSSGHRDQPGTNGGRIWTQKPAVIQACRWHCFIHGVDWWCLHRVIAWTLTPTRQVSATNFALHPGWLRQYTERVCETGHCYYLSQWPVNHYHIWSKETAELRGCRQLPFPFLWSVDYYCTWSGWDRCHMTAGLVSSGVARIIQCAGGEGEHTWHGCGHHLAAYLSL